MKVFKTADGLIVETAGARRRLQPGLDLDKLFAHDDPHGFLSSGLGMAPVVAAMPELHAPLGSQEVWAAGVTYQRSRVARVAESKVAGGSSFYDKVYEAKRPELFFKAAANKVAGLGQPVRIRRDSAWNVPEPELTLAVNSRGRIFGYTIGNDMSSRDIEAENPLYLPQAKVYDQSAALGPCLLVSSEPLPPETEIEITISRAEKTVFSGATPISRIKRPLAELVEYLFRDHSFASGCYLMTGTGIVPPDDFSLEPGDRVSITISPIGTLVNTVARQS
jgi:2-dehydro-3-deoxy-D-arabinonate dehydratase